VEERIVEMITEMLEMCWDINGRMESDLMDSRRRWMASTMEVVRDSRNSWERLARF
jgi:hypothetical protein